MAHPDDTSSWLDFAPDALEHLMTERDLEYYAACHGYQAARLLPSGLVQAQSATGKQVFVHLPLDVVRRIGRAHTLTPQERMRLEARRPAAVRGEWGAADQEASG